MLVEIFAIQPMYFQAAVKHTAGNIDQMPALCARTLRSRRAFPRRLKQGLGSQIVGLAQIVEADFRLRQGRETGGGIQVAQDAIARAAIWYITEHLVNFA